MKYKILYKAFICVALLFSLTSNVLSETEGLLKPCAPGIFGATPIPNEVVTNISVRFFGAGMVVSKLGLDVPCALQNWSGRDGDDFSFPRALDAYASPSVINVNSFTQTITFHADSVAFGGPYRSRFLECYPNTPDSLGGCDSQATITQLVAREANPAGFFEDKWTLLQFSDLFQFTRKGDCSSSWPGGGGQSSTCSYELKFALDDNGIPKLQKPIQLVLLNAISGEPTMPSGFSSYFPQAGADYAIPMLLLPGSSSQIVLEGSADAVSVGTTVRFTATVSGNLDPSALPIVSLRSRQEGTTTFTAVGQSSVDTNGVATFEVTVNSNIELQATLVGSAAGATVTSNIISVQAITPSSPTPTPTSDSEEDLTAQGIFNSLVTEIRDAIPLVKKKFKKSERDAQLALRANIRELARQLLQFHNTNSSEISTKSKRVKTARRKLLQFAKKKKKGFSKRKRQANKALNRLNIS